MTWTQIAQTIRDTTQRMTAARDALKGKLAAAGVTPAADTLSAAIDAIPAAFIPGRVVNSEGLTPTGTYANATYYDVTYGVKVAYGANGDIYLVMKGGTTTAYEYLRFVADAVPEGVTVETTVPTSTSYVSLMPGMLMVGIIHGVTGNVSLALVMDAYNASYDYTDVKISITPEV